MAEEGIAKTLSLTGTLHQAGNVCHIQEGGHLSMVSEIWQHLGLFSEKMQVS